MNKFYHSSITIGQMFRNLVSKAAGVIVVLLFLFGFGTALHGQEVVDSI